MRTLNLLKNKKGSVLLLVLIMSMICMIIVLSILERTNKQLFIQRQNAEYATAYTNAQSYISKFLARFYNGQLTYNSSQQSIDDALREGMPLGAKLILDPLNLSESEIKDDNFISILSNRSLSVPTYKNAQGQPIKDVVTVSVWCDNSPNSAIYLQFIYSNYSIGSIATVCDSGSNVIAQGGNRWGSGFINMSDTSNNIQGISVLLTDNLLTLNGKTYRKINYVLPIDKRKIDFIRATPMNGFNNTPSSATKLLVRMFDDENKVVGSSDPIRGTAIGYGELERTATIRFSAFNSIQLPSAFTYVFFEGNNCSTLGQPYSACPSN